MTEHAGTFRTNSFALVLGDAAEAQHATNNDRLNIRAYSLADVWRAWSQSHDTDADSSAALPSFPSFSPLTSYVLLSTTGVLGANVGDLVIGPSSFIDAPSHLVYVADGMFAHSAPPGRYDDFLAGSFPEAIVLPLGGETHYDQDIQMQDSYYHDNYNSGLTDDNDRDYGIECTEDTSPEIDNTLPFGVHVMSVLRRFFPGGDPTLVALILSPEFLDPLRARNLLLAAVEAETKNNFETRIAVDHGSLIFSSALLAMEAWSNGTPSDANRWSVLMNPLRVGTWVFGYAPGADGSLYGEALVWLEGFDPLSSDVEWAETDIDVQGDHDGYIVISHPGALPYDTDTLRRMLVRRYPRFSVHNQAVIYRCQPLFLCKVVVAMDSWGEVIAFRVFLDGEGWRRMSRAFSPLNTTVMLENTFLVPTQSMAFVDALSPAGLKTLRSVGPDPPILHDVNPAAVDANTDIPTRFFNRGPDGGNLPQWDLQNVMVGALLGANVINGLCIGMWFAQELHPMSVAFVSSQSSFFQGQQRNLSLSGTFTTSTGVAFFASLWFGSSNVAQSVLATALGPPPSANAGRFIATSAGVAIRGIPPRRTVHVWVSRVGNEVDAVYLDWSFPGRRLQRNTRKQTRVGRAASAA